MFYYLLGTLALLTDDTAVIDCGGVGYKLTVPASTVGKIASKTDGTVKLFTHLAVKEDAMDLYGFATEAELDLFRKLLSVSGIGPKGAVAILSILSVEDFARCVAAGDYKAIARANGVGSKTAQKIIVELKDKVAAGVPSGEFSPIPTGNRASEVIDTLLVYGFARPQIEEAMRGLDLSKPLEEVIADTLRKLGTK